MSCVCSLLALCLKFLVWGFTVLTVLPLKTKKTPASYKIELEKKCDPTPFDFRL